LHELGSGTDNVLAVIWPTALVLYWWHVGQCFGGIADQHILPYSKRHYWHGTHKLNKIILAQ